MKTILLMAYQISPTRGSEYAVGWNFTINLAKNNRVFVLCGASGDHMGDTAEVENYFKDNPHPNIHLIPIKPSKLANTVNRLNKLGLTPAFYIAYNLWHKQVYKIAQSIISKQQIDVIHHLNPIGFREPGYLWKIDKPFIWGPIGGAKFIKLGLTNNIPNIHKLFFWLKNIINHVQLSYNKRLCIAVEKSSELIFCNSEMKYAFETYLGKTGKIISEQGSNKRLITLNSKKKTFIQLDIVWAGNIRYIKNLPMLFHILSSIKKQYNWKLHLIGGGEKIKQTKTMALKLNIYDNIIWYGRKSRNETIDIMSQCDLHVLSSLSEGNPAVLYEAISLGIPTISLDQDGMHDILKNNNGILVPTSTYKKTIKLYAQKIDELIENPKILEELKERTKTLATQVTWEKKIQQFEAIYEEAILREQNLVSK